MDRDEAGDRQQRREDRQADGERRADRRCPVNERSDAVEIEGQVRRRRQRHAVRRWQHEPSGVPSGGVERHDRQRIGIERRGDRDRQVAAAHDAAERRGDRLDGPGNQAAGEADRDAACGGMAVEMPEVGIGE
jgi:hypothetical protein